MYYYYLDWQRFVFIPFLDYSSKVGQPGKEIMTYRRDIT